MRNGKTLEVNIHVKGSGTTKCEESLAGGSASVVEGAYLGGKLKMACEGEPIHSPRSRALARDTPQATIRVLISV